MKNVFPFIENSLGSAETGFLQINVKYVKFCSVHVCLKTRKRIFFVAKT